MGLIKYLSHLILIFMDKEHTIFLLEDDDAFLIVFKRWLAENGFRVVIARSVIEAKTILATMTPPSLFWLDYYLGEKKENGMEFFHWLKTQPELAAIPTFMVSITMDIKKLKEFEAEGITKTFSKANTNKEEILAVLKEILK